MKASIIIPTLNAKIFAADLINALSTQNLDFELIIIDSTSKDDTIEIFRQAHAQIKIIAPQDFQHGKARNLGAGLASHDYLVFLSQDALPANPLWLENLLRPLYERKAEASFARQLPRPEANPLEIFARHHNYPAQARVVNKVNIERLGIRAFFFSNSCSAVRRDVFEELGGFPSYSIMNEDMLFAARLLRADYRIAYAADAQVWHSHRYTLGQTFQRYFDIGVVFRQAKADLVGARAEREGVRYVGALLGELHKTGQYKWMPLALAESATKWLGVFLGQRYPSLPKALRQRLSMHKGYWEES